MLNALKKIMVYNKFGSQNMTFFVINSFNHSLEIKMQINTFILDQIDHFALLLKIIIIQSETFLNNFSPFMLYSCNYITNYQFYEYLPPQLRPLYFDTNPKSKGNISKIS